MNLLWGFANLSKPETCAGSGCKGEEGVGAGEDGRLDGRKKEGVLSTFIVEDFLSRFLKEWAKGVWRFY